MSELAPPPPPSVRRGQALEALGQVERQIAMLETRKRLLIAQVHNEDRGGMYARYVRDELALVWRRSARACQHRIDTALVFADFPAVHGLIGEGSWLIDHADAEIDELVKTGLDHLQQLQVLELVLSRRVHLTPPQVRQAVRTAAVVLFPDHAVDRAQQAEVDRNVQVYQDEPGVGTLVAHGPAHLVQAMMASLDALCRSADPDDPRTPAQRRFDTLTALVCGQITPTSWQVHVLTALSTLQGADELPGEVVGHGPIPAELARDIASQGVLRRVAVHDDGTLAAVDVTTHRPDLTPDPEPVPTLAPEPTSGPAKDAADETDEVADDEVSVTRDAIEVAPEAIEVAGDDEAEPTAADLSAVPVDQAPSEADLDAVSAMPSSSEPAERDEPSLDDLDWYARHRPPLPDETRLDPRGGRPAHLRTWWSDSGFRTALHRLATDPLRPVDLSTDTYVVPKALKRFLELRDRTCIFPGCPRKAQDCDKDHLIPWPRGSSSALNLASECKPHHIAKHEYFTVERLPDGTFRWTSPAGITADHPPRPVLDAWTYRTSR